VSTTPVTLHRLPGISHLNDAIEVLACGAPGNGGAHFMYTLGHKSPSGDAVACLKFQQGDPAAEINGLSNEALLAVLLHRMAGFQSGPFKCRDNAIIITHLEDAMLRMNRRTIERHGRGVLGQLTP